MYTSCVLIYCLGLIINTLDYPWDNVIIGLFNEKRRESKFGLEFSGACIDNLLVILKVSCENHIEHSDYLFNHWVSAILKNFMQ
jgi:hypothetical protein